MAPRLPGACFLPLARSGFRGLAEHAAASFAQLRALLAHARRNSFTVRNFRGTEPEDVAGAKSSLIVLGKREGSGSPQRRAHSRGNGQLNATPATQQLSLHDRPLVWPALRPPSRRVRRRGIMVMMVDWNRRYSTRRERRAPVFRACCLFQRGNSTR